jgi:lysophospholipase L1-like esterase
MKIELRLILACLIVFSCSSNEIEWAAIGDSITYLNEHQDETGNRITKGYLTRVSERMPHVEYVNKGYNGWTAIRIADEIESLDLEYADIYTVFLGTNDWWQGKPLGTLDDYANDTGNDTFFGAYRTIIGKLRDLNASARIILITPMQRGDFVYIADMNNNAYGSYRQKNGQLLKQFAEAVLSIAAQEKIEAIDLFNSSGITLDNIVKYKWLKDPNSGVYRKFSYPEYIGIDFNPATDEYPYPIDAIDMTYDGLHPSDKGYEIIAKMVTAVLKKR